MAAHIFHYCRFQIPCILVKESLDAAKKKPNPIEVNVLISHYLMATQYCKRKFGSFKNRWTNKTKKTKLQKVVKI